MLNKTGVMESVDEIISIGHTSVELIVTIDYEASDDVITEHTRKYHKWHLEPIRKII